MKKVLSLLLSVVIVSAMLFSVPFTSMATEVDTAMISSYSESDYKYEILSDNTVKITGYEGSDVELAIPNSLGGYDVSSIGDYAFSGFETLKSVILPDSITSIGKFAFEDCFSLVKVVLPDNITTIDEYAFANCDDLYNVIIPASVTSIGYRAFFGCTNLKACVYENSYAHEYVLNSKTGYVIIDGVAESYAYKLLSDDTAEVRGYAGDEVDLIVPSTLGGYNVSSIGEGAFGENANIASVIVSEGVTSICESAFENCDNLKSVIIPNSVTSIGNKAFLGCDYLTAYVYKYSFAHEYVLDNSVGFIAIDGHEGPYVYKLLSDGTAEIIACVSNKEEIIIPSIANGHSVTAIGKSAFKDNTTITNVVLPDTITSVGETAFYGCINIKSVVIPYSVTEIGTDAFVEYTVFTPFYVYEGSYGHIYANRMRFSTVFIDGYTDIYAYKILPDGTAEISGCVGVQSELVIPSTIYSYKVSSIGDDAFWRNDNITNVVISEGVTNIKSRAFGSCGNLVSVDIPNSVTNIGDLTFESCYKLEDVNIPYGVSVIGGDLFYECKSLTAIDIPASVTKIKGNAFYGCKKLKSVVIPDSVTTMGAFVFENCSNLESVVIPKSVVEIEYMIFAGCNKLTVYVYENSYAHEFVVEYNENYKFIRLLGDADEDDMVSISDATVIQKHLVGLETITEDDIAVADTNHDGKINILDATAIQKYLVGMNNDSSIGNIVM